MPSCLGALGPDRPTTVSCKGTAHRPATGSWIGTADVSVLEVERVLRRLAILRTGHSQIDTAFDPVRLANLRSVLGLALAARGRVIRPRGPSANGRP